VSFNFFRLHTDGTAAANPIFRGWWADAEQPADCIIYIFAHNDGGGTALSISDSHASNPDLGWVELHGTAPNNSGTRSATWYRRRKTTAISQPTITGAVDEWAGLAELITGIDATTAIDASDVTEQTASTTTPTAPSVTTSTDNCIIRRLVGCDGAAVAPVPRERPGSYMIVTGANDNPASSGGTAGFVAVHQVQQTAGATGTFTFALGSADGGRQMTIAFRKASGAAVKPFCRALGSDPTIVYPFPSTSYLSGATDIFGIITTIDGETVQDASSVSISTSGGISSETSLDQGFVGGWTPLIAVQAATPSGPAGYYGTRATITNGPVDWQNNLFFAIIRSPSANQRATDNPLLYFWDGSGNRAGVRTASRAITTSFNLHIVRLPTLTPVESSGSIDWSAVTQIGFAKYATINSTASARNQTLDIKYILAVAPGSLLASLHGAVDVAAIEDMLKSFGCGNVTGQIQGGIQLLARLGFQLGDGGTTPVQLSGEGASIAFPVGQSGYDVEDDDNVVRLNLGSGDDVNLSSLAIVSAEKSIDFHVDAASNAAGLTGSAATLIGSHLDLTNSQPLTGTTLIASPKATCYGATLDSCTIKSTTASDAAANWTANGGFTSGTIDLTGSTTDHHIELGTSVTAFDLTGTTLAGTAGTSNIHVLRTTGTVTISIGVDDDVPAYTTEGATVDIDQPIVTAAIAISGMPTAGASIRLQIANESGATATAWAATTAYAIGDKVLRSTGVGTESTRGLYFVCSTAGTSGGSEPTWTTTPGNTTTDGTAVWTCYKVLYYDDDPGAATYNSTYTDGTAFKAGDSYTVHFAELNGSVSFKTAASDGIATSAGFTVALNTSADAVYAFNALDGSSTAIESIFSVNYTSSLIVLDSNTDFYLAEAFAYYCYLLTTTQGMFQFWDGVTALDAGNYRNNTANADIYFDETAGFVKQKSDDTSRWFRDDGVRPVLDPTTGGSGIEINWRNPAYVAETGVSGLTPTESAQLAEIETIKDLVEADEIHTATTVEKRLRGTATPLLTKNWTGTPLNNFQAVDPP
jgi:hypothetical protein